MDENIFWTVIFFISFLNEFSTFFVSSQLWKHGIEVMKNSQFEDNTRESALELVCSVAESHPKLLKDKTETMKT